MTFSIVACDHATGEMGAAVVSFAYGFAPRVVFTKPGVGVVVSQMMAEPRYGIEGLALLESGISPEDALAQIARSDSLREQRQVVAVDTSGRFSAFTGSSCIAACGHLQGDDYTTFGAMVARPDVWTAMAQCFASAQGSLARRMVAALHAGLEAGGDLRGVRAAALVVVAGSDEGSWMRTHVADIRVDEHADPLAEVERQLSLQERYRPMELAFERATTGDLAGALADYEMLSRDSGARADPEVALRHGLLLTLAGDVEAARQRLDDAYSVGESWREVVRRLPAAGYLPADEMLMRRLTGE